MLSSVIRYGASAPVDAAVENYVQGWQQLREYDQKHHNPPVIVSLNIDRLRRQATRFLTRKSGNPETPFIVGITGASASGKTTFQKGLREKTGPFMNGVTVDNYFRDYSKKYSELGRDQFFTTVNLDTPKAYDLNLLAKHLRALRKGKTVRSPHYDFDTCTSVPNRIAIKPTPVLSVEGTMALVKWRLRRLYDLSVFMDAPRGVIETRWKKRQERIAGAMPSQMKEKFFASVMKGYDRYIACKKGKATLVLNATASLEDMDKVQGDMANLLNRMASRRDREGAKLVG